MALGPKKLSGFLAVALVCGPAALALLGGPAAVAQIVGGNAPRGGYYQPPGNAYGGGYGGWGGGWGGGFVDGWGAGSTPMGSYMTGMGNAIRAQGQYNLDTSGAAINLEEARKRNIENDVSWTNAYFEMRRINQANTHPKKSPTPPETWARLAHQATPARLPSSLLDPVTGQIDWPLALQGDEFKDDRDALDQMFAHRAATNGAIGLDGFTQIRKATDDALARLKNHIRQIDSRNYMEARNFLSSLAYEANFASSG